MKKGDTIQCANAEDLIDTMINLARHGIETDFDVNKKKGIWNLVVTRARRNGKKHNPNRP